MEDEGGGLPSPPRRFDDGGSQMHLPSCGPTWLARVSLDHNKDADHDHGDDDGKDEQWRGLNDKSFFAFVITLPFSIKVEENKILINIRTLY